MKQYIEIGDTVKVRLPYSEVCMHMRVAGQVRQIELVGLNSVQIKNDDGSPFSFPITTGEAGVYTEHEMNILDPHNPFHWKFYVEPVSEEVV